MLTAVGVGYGYGGKGRDAVESADFSASAGEVVALLGPNGAGKSTLLGLLDGRLEPTRGRLERPPVRAADGTLAKGSVAEESPHFEVLSGRDDALFFARAAGLDRGAAATAVDELFRSLALTPDAHRPVSQYSFGARRKLDLVEALAHDPRLILLDEPTVGLDADARDSLTRLLRERADRGTAVVVASHDTLFVEGAADRVVFMVRGRTRGGGSPGELVEALGGDARIVITLDAPLDLTGDFGRDGWAVEEVGNPVVVRAASGAGALPGICESLASAGASIRAISVSPPDLAEAFRREVGETLSPRPVDGS